VFAEQANAWRPRLRLADRVGGELRRLGIDRHVPAVAAISDEVAELLRGS
jgi:hypothetical protein